MALNNFKCYHLMPLHFKGLIVDSAISQWHTRENVTGFDKPGGNKIRITLFIRTAEKNFGDFRLRGRYKSSEVMRC